MDEGETFVSSVTNGSMKISRQQTEATVGTKNENDFDKSDESDSESKSSTFLSDEQYFSNVRDDAIDQDSENSEIIRFNSSTITTRERNCDNGKTIYSNDRQPGDNNVSRKSISEASQGKTPTNKNNSENSRNESTASDNIISHSTVTASLLSYDKQRNDDSFSRETSIINEVKTSANESDSEDSKSETTVIGRISSHSTQTTLLYTGKSKTKSLQGDSSSETDILYYIRTLFEEPEDQDRGVEDNIDESSDSDDESCCVCCCCCCFCCFPPFCCCKSKRAGSKSKRNKGTTSVDDKSTPVCNDNNSRKITAINTGSRRNSNETQNVDHGQTDGESVVDSVTGVDDINPVESMSVCRSGYSNQKSFLSKEKSKSIISKDTDVSRTAVLQENDVSTVLQDEVQNNEPAHTERQVVQTSSKADQKSSLCCFCCFPCLCCCKSPSVGTGKTQVLDDKCANRGSTLLAIAGTCDGNNEYSHVPVPAIENKGKEKGTKQTVQEKHTVGSHTKDNEAGNNEDGNLSSVNKQTENNVHQAGEAKLPNGGESSRRTQILDKDKSTANNQKTTQNDDEVVDLQDKESGTGKQTSCFCFSRAQPVKRTSAKRPNDNVGKTNSSTNIAPSVNNKIGSDKSATKVTEQHDQNNSSGLSKPNSTTTLVWQSQNDTENLITMDEHKSIVSDPAEQKSVQSSYIENDTGNKTEKQINQTNSSASETMKTKGIEHQEKFNTSASKIAFGKADVGQNSKIKSSSIIDKGTIGADKQMENKTDQVDVSKLSGSGESPRETQHLHKQQSTADNDRMTQDEHEVVDLQDMDSGTGKKPSCFCFFRTRPVKQVSAQRPNDNVGNNDSSSTVLQSVNSEDDTDKTSTTIKEHFDQNNGNKISKPNSTTSIVSQSKNDIGNLHETPLSERSRPAKQSNSAGQFSRIKPESEKKTLNIENSLVSERDAEKTKPNDQTEKRQNSIVGKHSNKMESFIKEEKSSEKGNVDERHSNAVTDNIGNRGESSVMEKEKINKDIAKQNDMGNETNIATAKQSNNTDSKSASDKNVSDPKKQSTAKAPDLQNSGDSDVERTSCFCFVRSRPSLNSAAVDSNGSGLGIDSTQNSTKQPIIPVSVNNNNTLNKVEAVNAEQSGSNCTNETETHKTHARNGSKISSRKVKSGNVQHACGENEKQTTANNELGSNKSGKRNSAVSTGDKQKGMMNDTKDYSNSPADSAKKERANEQELSDMKRKSSDSMAAVDGASNAGETTTGRGQSFSTQIADEEKTHTYNDTDAENVNAIHEQQQSKDDNRANKVLISNKTPMAKTGKTESLPTGTAKKGRSGIENFSEPSRQSISDIDQQTESKTLGEIHRTPTNTNDKDMETNSMSKSFNERTIQDTEDKIPFANDMNLSENLSKSPLIDGDHTERNNDIDKRSRRENTTQSTSSHASPIETEALKEERISSSDNNQFDNDDMKNNDDSGQSINGTSLMREQLDESGESRLSGTNTTEILPEPSNLDKSPRAIHNSFNHNNIPDKDEQGMANEATKEENLTSSSLKAPSMHVGQASSKLNADQSKSNGTSDRVNMSGISDQTIFPPGQMNTQIMDGVKQNDQGRGIATPNEQIISQKAAVADEDDTFINMTNGQQVIADNQKLENISSLEPKINNTNQKPLTLSHEPATQSGYTESNQHIDSGVINGIKGDADAEKSSTTKVQSSEQNSSVKNTSTVAAFWGSFASNDEAQKVKSREGLSSPKMAHHSNPDITDSAKVEKDGKEQSHIETYTDKRESSENNPFSVESFPYLINVMPEPGIPAGNNAIPVSKVNLPAKQQNIANKPLNNSAKNKAQSNVSNKYGHSTGAFPVIQENTTTVSLNTPAKNTGTSNVSNIPVPGKDSDFPLKHQNTTNKSLKAPAKNTAASNVSSVAGPGLDSDVFPLKQQKTANKPATSNVSSVPVPGQESGDVPLKQQNTTNKPSNAPAKNTATSNVSSIPVPEKREWCCSIETAKYDK